jgi:hypothetical protein
VDLVRERDAQNVLIGSVEMREIDPLSLLPVRLSLAFGCVSKAVRARRHYAGHTIAKSVSDIVQPRLAALILNAVVKKSRDSKVFIAFVEK